MARFFITLIAALSLAGCRCGSSPPSESVSVPPASDARGIEGRVEYAGPTPTPWPTLPCDPPPPMLRAGPLPGAIVHVRGAGTMEPTSLELSGDGCVFRPAAAVVALGSELVVANEGEALQTFHLRRLDGPHELPEQNLALPPGEGVLRYRLDRPGRYRVSADLMPWMEASILVVGAGTGTVTDDEGRFSVDPGPGQWTVDLWHRSVGVRTDSVEVPADGPASLYVTWSPSER